MRIDAHRSLHPAWLVLSVLLRQPQTTTHSCAHRSAHTAPLRQHSSRRLLALSQEAAGASRQPMHSSVEAHRRGHHVLGYMVRVRHHQLYHIRETLGYKHGRACSAGAGGRLLRRGGERERRAGGLLCLGYTSRIEPCLTPTIKRDPTSTGEPAAPQRRRSPSSSRRGTRAARWRTVVFRVYI